VGYHDLIGSYWVTISESKSIYKSNCWSCHRHGEI